jgi:hypothetical protein
MEANYLIINLFQKLPQEWKSEEIRMLLQYWIITLMVICELNSFTFHERLTYCFCNNSKVRSFVVLKW